MSSESVKAFVLAAGAGTRLRPLTYAIPKPMVPVANKPVLEHTVENLSRHGIRTMVFNLHHYPRMIREYFGKGERWNVDISYSYEPRLLGTAGGLKKVEKFFRDGTFLVMSGDGLSDINLGRVLEFHRRKKALGTMVLKAVDSRFEYGVTLTDKSGRIKKFIEKPCWSDVFSNKVNTGIYVFEPAVFKYIPKNKFYDFGKDVWPDLLRRRQPIYGIEIFDYWTDVGNLKEYRQGVRDALDGRLKINIAGQQLYPGIYVGENTKISRGARLIAPCVIGRDCHIENKAVVGPYTTLAAKCQIGQGALVSNSILWGRVRVFRGVKLDNCIIGYRGVVSSNITVYEGSVLNVAFGGKEIAK